MRISARKGRLIHIAPECSEAVVIWITNGFNTRNAFWKFDLKEHLPYMDLVFPKDSIQPISRDFPWKSHLNSMWELKSELKKLKYVYVFSNLKSAHSLEGENALIQLIEQALADLSRFHIKSVSFIIIPYTKDGGIPESIDYENSARCMIKTIDEWLKKNNNNLDIFLVDRVDGFTPYLDKYNSMQDI